MEKFKFFRFISERIGVQSRNNKNFKTDKNRIKKRSVHFASGKRNKILIRKLDEIRSHIRPREGVSIVRGRCSRYRVFLLDELSTLKKIKLNKNKNHHVRK